jgi:predicted metal-dependent peptidase
MERTVEMGQTAEALTKLKRARVELLLTQPFFGTLSLFLNLREVSWCNSAATDGRSLFYSPDFVDRLSEEECIFLLGHEVLHCALGHLWRRGQRDKAKWNFAIDYAANDLLCKAGFKMPKGGAFNPRYSSLAAETIYEMLPPFMGKQRYDIHLEKGDLTPEGVYDSPPLEESTWKLRAKSVIDVLTSQSKEPLGALREIGDTGRPVIDWRTFLSTFFATLARNDYTWVPPNKKYIARGFFLPVIRSKMLDIVVALDTSGSISNEDLSAFTSELCEIAATLPVQITMMACDAAVHEMMTYQPYEIPAVPRVSGNGGTDFQPVFSRIGEDDFKPACLIYFTDGFGTFPPNEPDYPVVWVLKRNRNDDDDTKDSLSAPISSGLHTPWGIELKI